jgi:hypothetical protein
MIELIRRRRRRRAGLAGRPVPINLIGREPTDETIASLGPRDDLRRRRLESSRRMSAADN